MKRQRGVSTCRQALGFTREAWPQGAVAGQAEAAARARAPGAVAAQAEEGVLLLLRQPGPRQWAARPRRVPAPLAALVARVPLAAAALPAPEVPAQNKIIRK